MSSKTNVELKENIEVQDIKEIPNYQVLLFYNIPA